MEKKELGFKAFSTNWTTYCKTIGFTFSFFLCGWDSKSRESQNL